MTSQNSQGMGYDADVSFTLNAIDRHGVAADLYNHHVTGDITATLSANNCETSTRSEPSVIEPNRVGVCAVDVYNQEVDGPIASTVTSAVGGTNTSGPKVLGLDHVMLSGGTTYQGRGYYEDVSGCMKTMPHGVMTDE